LVCTLGNIRISSIEVLIGFSLPQHHHLKTDDKEVFIALLWRALMYSYDRRVVSLVSPNLAPVGGGLDGLLATSASVLVASPSENR
jgi:hypothetical protein